MTAEILLAEAALVDGWIGSRRMGDRLGGAKVVHVEGEQIASQASAQRKPVRRAEVGVEVETEVSEHRLEIGLGCVRTTRGILDPLLGAAHGVAAREVAELELLRLSECGALQTRRSAPTDGDLLHVEVDEVPPLAVGGLKRFLDVEQEAGEVFAQAHGAIDQKKLLPEGGVALPAFDVSREREARRVTALPRIAAIEKT